MSRPHITVLLGDPRLPDPTKPGGRFTPDDLEQVERLRSALGELDAYTFEYWNDHQQLLADLQAKRPEFVLNFCDTGFRNDARHELHVAAVLELLAVPYSGSGPAALGLCFDKSVVRAVAQAHGVPVPWEHLLPPGADLPDVDYPAFIKPNRGDGSFGITRQSIVHDAGQARAYVGRLHRELPGQTLIVQEFLSGAEYGVGVVGNPGADFTILPVLEVDYSRLDPELPRLLDYSSKTDPTSPYWNDVRFQQARLGPRELERITGWCAILFARLGMRDYARCDFRADARGELKLMEVNPNPAWCWDGKLAHMAGLSGEGHSGLLRQIIEVSRRRCFGPS